MKADIHPNYKVTNFICACGATFVAGSTIKDDFKTEICSKCHPFYTGKQKLIDSSGRVDKFRAKMEKAQKLAEKNMKKNNDNEEEPEEKKSEKATEEAAKEETTE